MELLKSREEIIAKVEGEDFFKIMDSKEVVIQVREDFGTKPETIVGTPYIMVESKGRTFGIEAEGFGKIEIYSHMFNNLTNANVSLVRFR